MAEDITKNGVAAGKHDIAAEGEYRVIYDELTLATYDDADDGTGNSFDPTVEYGFSRLGIVHVNVQAAGYVAQYDYDNNSIRVYEESGSSGSLAEVGQGTDLSVDLRVEIRGMG